MIDTPKPAAPKLSDMDAAWLDAHANWIPDLGAQENMRRIARRLDGVVTENLHLMDRTERFDMHINSLASSFAAERDRLRGLLERVLGFQKIENPGPHIKRLYGWLMREIEAALAADAGARGEGGEA